MTLKQKRRKIKRNKKTAGCTCIKSFQERGGEEKASQVLQKRHNRQRSSQEGQKEEESKKKLRLEGTPATKAEEKT